jgi:hypothetical protein
VTVFNHIPGPAREFLHQCIDSVEQLEVLLLLQRTPDKSWTADSVADALGMARHAAAAALEGLGSRNLLDVRIAEGVFYQFRPGTPDLDAAARSVAQSYREHRALVLAIVAGRPSTTIRDFADAFRLRDDDDRPS